MEMIIDFIYKLFKFKNDQYSANYLFKNFFSKRYIKFNISRDIHLLMNNFYIKLFIIKQSLLNIEQSERKYLKKHNKRECCEIYYFN